MRAGADKDHQNNDGWTPLHLAARWGHKEIVELSFLTMAGADKDRQTDEGGWTPLHWAALFGYKEVVEALIRAGASFNEPNNC